MCLEPKLGIITHGRKTKIIRPFYSMPGKGKEKGEGGKEFPRFRVISSARAKRKINQVRKNILNLTYLTGKQYKWQIFYVFATYMFA